MPQIICENASLGYENRPIVKDLSFTVNAGDYLCIVGENGSGKSTLMKTILNLTPPLAGSIRMEGLSPTEIGYLPQQTQVQRDFPASVQEIVLSGFQGRCGLRPFYTKEEKALAKRNLERIGIGGTMDRAAVMSKIALTRSIDSHNPMPEYAKLEDDLLELINETGIGPQLGGTTSCLGVNIEWGPTHIAGLPVAVTICCHACRHAKRVL